MRPVPPFWLLVMITASATLPLHIFIPALPEAGRALGVTPGEVQAAISIYIAGLAAGQLIYGPLSDSFGRRPVLMAGLAVYALGGLAVALAPSLDWLLAGRLVQSLGSCAGLALGRAIVRDTSSPATAMSSVALLNVTLVMSPGLAPLVGGLVAGAWGWRAMFVLLSIVGAVILALTWRLLPETSQPGGNMKPSQVLSDYRALLGSREFLAFAAAGGFASLCIHALLVTAPFLLVEELHEPVQRVGLYMGIMISGMALGNAITARLAPSMAPGRLFRIGGMVSLASSLALLCTYITGRLDTFFTVCAVVVFTIGGGIANPIALASATHVDERLVGAASGLAGSIQTSIGAICAALASASSHPPMAAMTILFGSTLLSQAAFAAARRAGST